MSHRSVFVTLASFVLLMLPVVAQDNALFSATFDDGTLPETLNIQYGTYDIVDGQLDYSVDNGGFMVIPSGIDWTDYAIEVDLTLVEGSVWLQARTGADLCSGYYLTLNPARDAIDLSVSDRQCNFTVLAETSDVTVPAEAFTARIDVEGDQIRGYLNDELILTATDGQFASGYPTLNIFPIDNPAQVQFDRIDVFALPEPASEPESTPEATAELTPETTTELEATVEVTTEPEITPEATIEETVAPEITPEVTTEPEITPETTAEVTAEPLVDVELPPVNQIPLDDNPERVIDSLIELGLIPDRDGDLYTEDGVVISRIGGWFEPLFEGASSRHAVMSGDIFFLPNSEGETCLLSARIERDEIGVALRYLDVGINSLDEVFIGETADNGAYSLATQEGMLTASGGNILFVVYGDRLSVYVDGRVAFQNIVVTRRDGSFGVSSNASTSYTVCHVTDLWLYTFEG